MNTNEFSLDELPPETRKTVCELAKSLGCSEEQVILKMLHALVNQLEHPNGSDIQEFVREARQALKPKNIS